MSTYIVLINWNDGSASEIEVNAKNIIDAENKAIDSINETIRTNIYKYYVLKKFNKKSLSWKRMKFYY